MNTVKSFWVGWGSLCAAGGVAYYFAKKSINEDRAVRYEADLRRRQMQESLEYSSKQASSSGSSTTRPPKSDPSPTHDLIDPAPTRHAPASEGQQVREKSKYEASEPYRSTKGDRFS
ncbi:hypothetical protein PVAG01_04912 [Phlyctema vagabunda]|uniref:Uncharacterized protein n=1 Tax=Phlyctema vagabunda TaxID=108571 RepID=A0ABR4PIJ9_9HELO